MIYRKSISDKVLSWLKKGNLIPKVTMLERYSSIGFDLQCDKVKEVIQNAGDSVSMTKTKEDADQIVIKVILYEGCEGISGVGLMTPIYAVVHTKWLGMKKQHIITLDEYGNVRKIKKIPDTYISSINGGDCIEKLKVLRTQTFSFYV